MFFDKIDKIWAICSPNSVVRIRMTFYFYWHKLKVNQKQGSLVVQTESLFLIHQKVIYKYLLKWMQHLDSYLLWRMIALKTQANDLSYRLGELRLGEINWNVDQLCFQFHSKFGGKKKRKKNINFYLKFWNRILLIHHGYKTNISKF